MNDYAPQRVIEDIVDSITKITDKTKMNYEVAFALATHQSISGKALEKLENVFTRSDFFDYDITMAIYKNANTHLQRLERLRQICQVYVQEQREALKNLERYDDEWRTLH